MEQEIWKPISEFEDLYEVSNYGNVRAKDRYVNTATGIRHYKSRMLIQEKTRDGHYRVALCNAGYKKRILVHRLVASAFIPNPNNYPVINHIDGNPANNYVSNLEWTTIQENVLHAYKLGLLDITKTKEANSIPIVMYAVGTNKVLQNFPSMVECHRETGYALSTISYHCKYKATPRDLPVYFRYQEKE